jgi:uncharacterized protein
MHRWAKYFVEAENIAAYEQIFENILVIDTHTHIGEDQDGHKLSTSELLKQMDNANIDKCVAFPLNDFKHNQDFSKPNSVIHKAWKNNPGRIIPFFRLNPKFNWKKEFDKCAAQEFKGIKLHPKGQNFKLLESSAMSIYEKAADAELAVLIHTGFGVENPSHELSTIARKFPKLKLIVGHSAFLDLDNAVRLLGGLKNVLFETSTVNMLDMFQLLKELPNSQIAFGSDTPYYDQNLSIELIIDTAIILNKKPSQVRDILGKNLERTLK